MFAEDLGTITNKGAKVTRLLGDLISRLSPVLSPRGGKPRRMFVTDENIDEVPDWLGGPAQLQKLGYANPGQVLPKPKPKIEPNSE